MKDSPFYPKENIYWDGLFKGKEKHSIQRVCKKRTARDFPGGAVVKNPPANAGGMGSSPGPGRSHMPWSNKAHVPQLLSLRSRAHVPQLRPDAAKNEINKYF